MYKKILYPTDFSDVAKKALDYIIQLKDAGTYEVIVLYVIDKRNLDVLAWYGVNDLLTFEQDMEEKLREEMSEVEALLTKRGFEVKLRIERGLPFKEILRVEEEEDVSLIVIGSHGKSNIKEMLLGSVSEKVLRKATKPVLVVKR